MMSEETIITEALLDERLKTFGKEIRRDLRDEVSDMIAVSREGQREDMVRAIDGMRAGIEAKLTIQDRAFEQRFREVGNDIQLALRAISGLRDDIYGDPDQRSGPSSLYERLDEIDKSFTTQIQALGVEVVTRLIKVEKWIAQRTAIERMAIKIIRAPLVVFVRRFLPWAVLAVGMTGAAVALAQVLG